MDFVPQICGIFRSAFASKIGLSLALLGSLAPLLDRAHGQGINNRLDPDNIPDVFVPASRDLQLQLSRARKALTEGSFADAADMLGSLIAVPEADRFSPDAEDYFLDAAEAGGTFRSLKSEVLRLLGSMPPKGRDAYEIRYGADAKALVNAAVESGDIEKLTEAARMYFHTSAGYEAMLLLARYHYIQGRPLAAALCAQRVVDSAGAANCEPEASLLLAASWLNAGYAERAKATLIALRKKNPNGQVKIEGKSRPLFTSDNRALDWLKELIGEVTASIAAAQENWVMHRGDPARNAESKGGSPVRTPVWQALPVFDPDDESILREVERSYREQPGSTALMSVLHPLAVGDNVIMRLPDRVIALDFITGKAKWEYPWEDSVRTTGTTSLEASRNQTSERDRRRRRLTQRVWENAADGQLSSDGELIYFLESLDSAQRFQNSLPNPIWRGRNQFDFYGAANTLVCLELQSEGRQKWVVGGMSGEDEPRLAGAWFLGAPLAMQGQVFVLAEIMGEIRLVVLDSESGQLQWWQQLCQIDDFTPIIHDTERRFAGCSPSFADGVMVCPTGAGAVVAVDIATRSLIWGHRYQGALQRKASAYGANATRDIGKRWMDCTVTIAEGKVVVCTADTDELHCLDLLTGKRLWGPTRRNDALYPACVRNETLYMVHAESMTALRMNDAGSAWKSAISLKDSRPSGRGFVDGEYYYLPVENSQILKINLTKGEIAERIPTAYPLGNLVCHRNAVIAQSTLQWLSLFHQLEPLRETVAQKLAANAKDAWALARQGEILAHDGKPKEAIAALKASLETEPKSRSTRSILARTMLGLLRADFVGNPDLVGDASKYIDRPEERAELLQLELSGLMKAGALPEAFDRLMRLVVDSERPGVPGNNELIDPPGDPKRRVTRERWQRGLLKVMWERGTPELRKTMSNRFAQEGERIGKEAGAERLARFVELFGGFPGAERPLVQLIKIETLAANYLRAEMLLDLLKRYDSTEARATADVLSYELAAISNQPSLAASALAALHAGKEPVTLLDQRSLADWLKGKDLKSPPQSAATWPKGAVLVEPLEEQRTAGFGGQFTSANFRVRPSDSSQSADVLVSRMGSAGTDAIMVRDRFGGDLVRLDLDRMDSRQTMYMEIRHTARVRGNFLLVSQGFQLLAMDLHRSAAASDSVLQWSMDLVPAKSNTYQGSSNGQRTMPMPNRSPLETAPPRTEMVYTAVDRPIGQTSDLRAEGICFHSGTRLLCVSPLTGKTLWERTDVPMGHDLFADESTLVVCDRDDRLVRRFRLTDGSELTPMQLATGEKPAEAERVWSGLGSHVLTSQLTASGKVAVRLWDFANESPRLAWMEEMPAKSVGCIVDGVEVAVLDPSGKLAIYPLDESRPPIRQTLDVSDGMYSLSVQRAPSAYYVYVHAPLKLDPNSNPTASASVAVAFRGADIFHGSIHAIDRQQGALLWPSPARIDQNGLVSDIALESPVIVFAKVMKLTNSNRLRVTSTTAPQGTMVVVDKATGRTLYEKYDFGMQLLTYCRVEVSPKSREVSVSIPAATFGGVRLIYTDQPRPPEPPAQSGNFTLRP